MVCRLACGGTCRLLGGRRHANERHRHGERRGRLRGGGRHDDRTAAVKSDARRGIHGGGAEGPPQPVRQRLRLPTVPRLRSAIARHRFSLSDRFCRRPRSASAHSGLGDRAHRPEFAQRRSGTHRQLPCGSGSLRGDARSSTITRARVTTEGTCRRPEISPGAIRPWSRASIFRTSRRKIRR